MRRIEDINSGYAALATSAVREVSSIERDFNALMLSRSGFVYQEIKDLEYDVANAIFERAAEVEDQVCILIARSQLETASETAGTSSQGAYRDILQRMNIMQILEVYPTLAEINRAIPSYATQPLTLFGSSNSVSDMNGMLARLTSEVDLHESLFEEFVDQILREMIIFNNYLNRDLISVLAESLEATRRAFISSAADIRNFLANECV